MFTVSTAASSTALTTRTRVKAVLGISGASEDAYLDILIAQASAFVCDRLNVATAADGTRTLGRETLIETITLREKRPLLQLARVPLASITSIYEDDSASALVEDTDFEAIKPSGFLRRKSASVPGLWSARKIVVTYVAGWRLPGDSGRSLPEPIESAVFDLIKNARAMQSRSADIKAEEVNGVGRTEYFANIMNVPGAMPPETAAKLEPYVHFRP
ncbi:MAG: hypothetical protein Rhirs2KO_18400 [Rhizobiaceae bacterium]